MDTETFLNSADFAVNFFNSLPLEQFNNALKINRNWYKECARELRERQRIVTEKFQDLEREYELAREIYDKEFKKYSHMSISWRRINLKQFSDKRNEMHQQRSKYYCNVLVKVDKACIRCGFFDLIDKERLNRWKRIYNYGSIKFRKFALPDSEAIVIAAIDALKEVIKSAHNQGFNPTHYLITDHIKIIKEIRLANNPEQYILSLAKKEFSDDHDEILVRMTYSDFIERTYHGNLLQKIKKLRRLYYKIAEGSLDWWYDWMENN